MLTERVATRAALDLREHLANLEAHGKLRRVQKEVDKDWEIGCIARWVFQAVPDEERYALLFERIKGYDIPLTVGAFGGSRAIYALAMGCQPEEIYQRWIEALTAPLPPEEVRDAPVQEVRFHGDAVDLYRLPVPVWTPGKDAGPYFTSHAVVTRDPDTGIVNVGNYRLQLRGRNEVGIQIFPNQHIGLHLQRYRARGYRTMPIAIAIGIPPTLGLCATAKIPYGVDEYAVAGAMARAPLQVTRALTVDLPVPARAEIVLEGEVPVDELVLEGPFGEYVGYMGLPGPKHHVYVHTLTCRARPIFQSYISQLPPSESCVLQQQASGAMLYKHLVHDLRVPGVRDVHWTEASSRTHTIIQMKPLYPGHARKVMMLAASILDGISPKWVTVVDEDIDIRDPFMVEWAIASRVDPATDVVILNDMEMTVLDPATTLRVNEDKTGAPLTERVTGAKLLIDATIKRTYPNISLPPKDLMYRALERWEETGLPPITVPERTRKLLDAHPGNELYYEPFRR
ncbi:MAG TPA: UbiD family decarboxylase [Chloroflexota bacterium]|nr:UbiD family decarboxylase [Chloroflexota bacterium]HZU07661.1 UbiD family decarboxylase [Chloroflexota bacterium]